MTDIQLITSGNLAAPPGLILLGYRGSIAHGMYVPPTDSHSTSDTDLVGFVIAAKKYYLGLEEWGSRGTQELKQGHFDCVWYELRKAIALLLAGNPNIVSTLWMRPEDYLRLEPEGRRLIEQRNLFVGKHIYESFAGYASAQLQKMETREPAEIRDYLGVTYELKKRGMHPTDERLPADLGDYTDCSAWGDEVLLARYRYFTKKGENLGYLGDKRKKLVLEHGYDSKNAAHCIRLLRMCKEFLASGEMNVYRADDAAELLEIKAGQWPLESVKGHAAELFAETKEAYAKSTLPAGPDRERVQTLLIELIEAYWERQ